MIEKVGNLMGMNNAPGGLGKYCARRWAQKARVTSRVQGWSASKVRWSTGRGCLNDYLSPRSAINESVFGLVMAR